MRSFLLLLGLGLLARGSAAAEEIEVSTVKFANVRAPAGATNSWWEADVALNVRPAAGTMVARVRVTLTIGCELPATGGSERRVDYYRAEAECVALESGRADVRFYLPPELVKRDQLHGDPKFWVVAVAVGGRGQTLGRNAASPALANPEARRNFESRAGSAAAANDGILVPQFLSPFASEYPRSTPSFVRHDSR